MHSELLAGPNLANRLTLLLGALAALCALEVQSEVLRDPTQPLDHVVLTQVDDSPLKLESVLIASGRRLATINGKTVSLNQSVAGVKVINIVAGSVTVIAKGRRQQLFVSKPLNMKKAGEP